MILENKIILVTGGTGSLGKVLGKRDATEDCDIFSRRR